MLELFRYISLPYFLEARGRTALVIGGAATGVALIVAIHTVNASVYDNFRSQIEAIAGPADLQVTLGLGEVGFSESVVETIRAQPGVAAAVPLVRGTLAVADDPSEAIQLFGVDLLVDADLERYRFEVVRDGTDPVELLNDPSALFITKSLAADLDVALSGSVELSTPRGVRTFTVRGLIDGGGLASALGGRVAVADLFAAQLLLGKERLLDQIDIVVADDADVDDVAARLTELLAPTLRVLPPEQHGMQYEGVLASFQAMLTGLSSLCLIAGVFVIYNATATASFRRAASFARLRLLGASKRQLAALLYGEALLLGAVGALIGVFWGLGLGWLLTGTVTESMGVIFQLRFSVDQVSVDASAIMIAVALGIAATVFASSFAVRRTTNADLLTVLTASSETVTAEIQTRRMLIYWGILMFGALGSFVIEDQAKSIAWGNFGSSLWNASVIVIAIPLMDWLADPLTRFLTAWFGGPGQIAAGSIARASTRTGVTVAAVALILTVAIMLTSLVTSCRESLRSYFAGVLSADITVSAQTTDGGWLETPLPESLADDLVAVAGVTQVAMLRAIPGHEYAGHRIALVGMSNDLFDSARAPSGWFREGTPRSAEGPMQSASAAMASTSFSDRYGVYLGDVVSLDSPTGVVRLPIVGVVPDYVSDRGSIIVNRETLRRHWHDTRVNRFLLFLEPSANVENVRREVKAGLGDEYRLKMLTLRELLDYHTGLIDRAFAVMNSIQLLIIIVAIVGIFDLLLARILERRTELAVWQVVGAGRRAVRRSIMIESATIGTIGSVLGVAVGMVTAWLWIRIHFRELLGYYVEYHFAVAATVWYVTLVVITTVLAGYGAAYQATRGSILDGIRRE